VFSKAGPQPRGLDKLPASCAAGAAPNTAGVPDMQVGILHATCGGRRNIGIRVTEGAIIRPHSSRDHADARGCASSVNW